MEVQGGEKLDTLAAVATDGTEIEDTANNPSGARQKTNSSGQYQPITDEAELAVLRGQGLTKKGESKVRKGDLRCRPPRVYGDTLFDKKLPQFRLRTVVETARAEDVVMLWAFVTGRDNKLRENEFRFDSKYYTEDLALVTDLKALNNSSDAMVTYLKNRFGTLRDQKIDAGFSSLPTLGVHPTSLNESEQATLFSSQAQHPQHASAVLIPKEEEKFLRPLEVKHARAYVKDFRDELLKKKKEMHKNNEANLKKTQNAEEKKVELNEEEDKECQVRALHKAAWDGQAKAAFDLATQLKDFNATLPFNYNYTPLHQAVLGSVGVKRRANVLTAERLIDHGARIGAQDIFGRTPLHHASRRGDLEMMTLLISKGADCNAIAHNGCTPLHGAAEGGGLAAVQKLREAGAIENPQLAKEDALGPTTRYSSLEESSLLRYASSTILPDSPVQQCGTALHWAARAGQDDVVQYFLEKCNFDANARDWHGTTPLQAAAREYKDEFLDRLKVGGYRAGMENKRKKLGLQIDTVDRGRQYANVVLYLRGYGADIDAVDNDKRTALHIAAASGNLKCVKLLSGDRPSEKTLRKDDLGDNVYLLAIKSDPESVLAVDDQSSLESQSQYWQQVDTWLVEGNVNVTKDIRGRTALHLAVLAGKPSVVLHLISAQAEVNARDNQGATPLLLGTRAQQVECVKELLNQGADPDAMDKLGCSSLSAAALAGELDIVELLLENNADVNLQKQSENGHAGEGRTALHDAAEEGNLHVVECLIEHGADVNTFTHSGETPLHVAARYGHIDVVQALLAAGSKIDTVDCKGRTAREIAQKHCLDDVVDLLRHELKRIHGPAALQAEDLKILTNAQKPAPSQQPEDTLYSTWQSRFGLLNEFVEAYGRVPAPDEWFKGYQLGTWVDLQKEKIRWDEMPENEFEAMGSVGTKVKDWGVGLPWMDWLQNIKEFVAANDKLPSAVAPKELGQKKQTVSPTLEVDKKILDLGWWCKFQQCCKAGKEGEIERPSLDKGQIRELDGLRQWRWESAFIRKRQRILLCLRLKLFCMKHKRLPTPDEHYLGVPLGRWCQLIRKLKLWSEIPLERQDAIEKCVCDMRDGNEIFEGSIRALWTQFRLSTEDYLECLNAFVREHKRLPQRKDVVSKSINIGMWLQNQRRKFKKGILAAEEQQRIEELCRTHSLQPLWSLDGIASGKSGDLDMQDAEKGRKKDSQDVEDGTSALEKQIETFLSKAKDNIELKSAEVLQLIQLWRQAKQDIVQPLMFQPPGGSTFFVDRKSKFRQDGYKWKKESRSILKVNGIDKLQCCYANSIDGTIQRRIYWELELPNLLSRALVFVHYIDKATPSLKRTASAALLNAKQAPQKPPSFNLDILVTVAADEDENVAAAEGAPAPLPPSVEPDKSTQMEAADADDEDNDADEGEDPLPKRRRRYPSYKKTEGTTAGGTLAAPRRRPAKEEVPVLSPDDVNRLQASIRALRASQIERIRELLKKLPIPRVEKEIPAGGNSQFAALADQLYGDSSRHPEIRALVVKQLRKNPEKYASGIHEYPVYDDKKTPSYSEYCSYIEKDDSFGGETSLQAVADIFETTVSVASLLPGTPPGWINIVGEKILDKPKIDPLVIIVFNDPGCCYYSTTVLESENEKKKQEESKDEMKEAPVEAAAPAEAAPPPKEAAAPPAAPTSLPSQTVSVPPILTEAPIADLQEKGLLTTIVLPASVVEKVAAAPLNNQVAMSSALKALYDHGVGGPAMLWFTGRFMGKKLSNEEKEYVFKGVQEYIAQGKVQEAAEFVQSVKEGFE